MIGLSKNPLEKKVAGAIGIGWREYARGPSPAGGQAQNQVNFFSIKVQSQRHIWQGLLWDLCQESEMTKCKIYFTNRN